MMKLKQLAIRVPALPQPTLEALQEDYPGLDSIERDMSPTEGLTVATSAVLRRRTSRPISCEEYERRLAQTPYPALGYQHALWLMEHQDEFPEFVDMPNRYRVYGIDFPGIVVVNPVVWGLKEVRNRLIPMLVPRCGRWRLDWRFANANCHATTRVAISGSVVHPTTAASHLDIGLTVRC